jgi:L-rhamnose mutarotase
MNRPPRRFLKITGLRPEHAPFYRELHTAVWPSVLRMIKECHVQNYSIHEQEIGGKLYLIAYLEYVGDDWEGDNARMAADPETRRWWTQTDPCQEPLPEAAAKGAIWVDATEVFYLH